MSKQAKNVHVEGVMEFVEMLKALHSKGISYYKISKKLGLPPTRVGMLLNESGNSKPTLNDISNLENLGYKIILCVLPQDEEKIYRAIQDINKKSYQKIFEELQKLKDEKRKRKTKNESVKMNHSDQVEINDATIVETDERNNATIIETSEKDNVSDDIVVTDNKENDDWIDLYE